jgi:hypothetical protein
MRHMRTLRPLIPWLLLAPLGCGGSTAPLSLSEFITSCSTASDCIAVAVADVCTACACPDSAINAVSQSKYQLAFSSARASCGALPICVTQCVKPHVACTMGACIVSP